jgi:hypothetical protein
MTDRLIRAPGLITVLKRRVAAQGWLVRRARLRVAWTGELPAVEPGLSDAETREPATFGL